MVWNWWIKRRQSYKTFINLVFVIYWILCLCVVWVVIKLLLIGKIKSNSFWRLVRLKVTSLCVVHSVIIILIYTFYIIFSIKITIFKLIRLWCDIHTWAYFLIDQHMLFCSWYWRSWYLRQIFVDTFMNI